MSKNNDKVSFWKLLNDKKIVIPIIQRDYAQGREGKEFLRERFLGQLFDALKDNANPLVLDFVYGSVEKQYALSTGRPATSYYSMAASLVSGIVRRNVV
ncbi:MAG: hypothetical protein L6V80_06700 [Bacteroidales bacterium]|nr:MAG: hypothetical protein L6V80_06700 [Bacteroidales bacterium]